MTASLMRPFHLAVPVVDLEEELAFFLRVFGCSTGRRSTDWVDLDFFGHQLVLHRVAATIARHENPVDGHDVPVPHFGIVLAWDDWHRLSERLRAADVEFIIEPTIRFAGEVGEQATLFMQSPGGLSIEMKAFADDAQLFAS